MGETNYTLADFKAEHKAYLYALDVVNKKIIAAKYVIKQCEIFINDIENIEDCKYFLDLKDVEKISKITKLINMATGTKVGQSAYDALAGFQWFFLINALCWKHKEIPIKRRYEKSVLLIARKSGKSFLVGLIFVILFILEPKFSEFYSVAPDLRLSTQVKKELEQMIQTSPALEPHFKVIKKNVICNINSSKYEPLAFSHNRMDGSKANVFVADEVGSLPTRYPIDAMLSSQMGMINRTGILISTAYETLNNPMTQEVDFCKKVLDGEIQAEEVFSMLYMPDDIDDWLSDKTLYEANPLAIEIDAMYEFLLQQRRTAIEIVEAQKNFKTKHLNIFVDGDEGDVYIPTDRLRKCKLDTYDWKYKEVYLGLDLALTTDNCGLSMVTHDKKLNKYISKVWAFYPKQRQTSKSKLEKIDYEYFDKKGWSFACGDEVVSYEFIEEFIKDLENKYKVKILNIGYDRYNCISTANRLYSAGYNVTEIKQHSSILHPATKFLKECVFNEQFGYEDNLLYEINFSNAKTVLDTNLNGYVNKRKSSGKIDLVASTINAMVFHEKEKSNGESVYKSRGIRTI